MEIVINIGNLAEASGLFCGGSIMALGVAAFVGMMLMGPKNDPEKLTISTLVSMPLVGIGLLVTLAGILPVVF